MRASLIGAVLRRIILIDFAAFVIGQDDWFWTVAGIMLSIALLAIAMLNNPIGSNSKK